MTETKQRRPRRSPEEIAAERAEKARLVELRKRERQNRKRRKKAARERRAAAREKERQEREDAKRRQQEHAAAAAADEERKRQEQLARLKAETDALPRRQQIELGKELGEIRKQRRATASAEARPQRRRVKTTKATVAGPDNVIKEVTIQAEAAWSMRGLEQHQKIAAERFFQDWQAVYPSQRSPRLEPGVDGGRCMSTEERRIDAGKRIRQIEAMLKMVDPNRFRVLEMAVIYGMGPERQHKLGGEPIVVISTKLKDALNMISGFYGSPSVRGDRTGQAAAEYLRKAQQAA